jgi:hypothetical protein
MGETARRLLTAERQKRRHAMTLQVGIVGLPNVGKSTLFNALTRAGAAVASYPFTTIDPNIGIAEVPDPRLADIAAIVGPERIIPAAVEFVDIAGLVKGASQGEGLGNQFLGHIRNVDAIALVVRCFQNPDIPHVTADLDPMSDIQVIDTELMLADLATVERRLEQARQASKGRPRDFAVTIALYERAIAHLDAGNPARALEIEAKEEEAFRDLNLLTAKPRLFVANVGEDDCPDGGPLADAVREAAAREDAEAVAICADMEAGLADWTPEDAAAYRAELGLKETGLARLAQAAYRLLRLVTFFTTTGGHEVRAWAVRENTPAPAAAGKVHTDMERGFIRAEVIAYPDLMRAGSFADARSRGLLRLEGREYLVQDGDIIHFRFAV